MLAAWPPDERRRRVYDQLVALQAAIFDLDYFGEENWEIDPSQLARHWDGIVAAVDSFGGIVPAEEALANVRAYMSLELAMRSGTPVTKHAITDFYRLKCCDVRLLRRLIGGAMTAGGQSPELSEAWDLLDTISEVGDDLDDLIEDQAAFNGNRLLASFGDSGVVATIEEYRDFLHEQGQHAGRLAAAMARRRSGADATAVCREAAGVAVRLSERIAAFRRAERLQLSLEKARNNRAG